MYKVSSSVGFCCDAFVFRLSMLEAAVCKSGRMLFSGCPLLISRSMKFAVISMKSFSSVFCHQYRYSSPGISPLKQLVGWADRGGIYKNRLSSFWYVTVVSYLSLIVMVISRKFVDSVSGSTFHFRVPNWFRVCLKRSQCFVGSVRDCVEFFPEFS